MHLAVYFANNKGSQAKLARALGLPQSLPSAWASANDSSRRPVPINHCLAIERATNGQVTRADLRPHDWQDIWPDIAADATTPPATVPKPQKPRRPRTDPDRAAPGQRRRARREAQKQQPKEATS